MEIYILRHGEAQLRDQGIPDKDRTLVMKGKKDVRAVVELASHVIDPPSVILTSPLVRASETAAIAKEVFRKAKVVETRALLPEAKPDAIWKELIALKDVNEVLLAGHEPHVGQLTAFLLEAGVRVDFKKGALVRISVPAKAQPPRGILKWMITPKLARKGPAR